MGDGSCCCICCSTNTDYWGVAPTEACVLTTISKLEKNQTLVEACPDPYDNATTDAERKALLCSGVGPKFRIERNPVKSGQCDSASPDAVASEQKCYVCEDCVMACSGGTLVGCEPPDFCEGTYDCIRPGKPAVYAVAPCLSAVQTKCQWCNANERSEDPALWDSICTVPRGECDTKETNVCLTGGPPPGSSGDCYYVNFTEESPFSTLCSETTSADCSLSGQPCGCDGDPCCAPGIIVYPVTIDLGSDICGSSYQGCGAECSGAYSLYCCKGTPNCLEGNPCAIDCA